MAYQYEEFKRDVYKLTDINLDLYKERQMKRRIESLIARKGFDGFESFYKGMKQDEGLLRTFVSYLTINVSQFYRNPQQWMNFDQEIIPYLRKKYGDTLTIWSAACSTGDEPFCQSIFRCRRSVSLRPIWMRMYLPLQKRASIRRRACPICRRNT